MTLGTYGHLFDHGGDNDSATRPHQGRYHERHDPRSRRVYTVFVVTRRRRMRALPK